MFCFLSISCAAFKVSVTYLKHICPAEGVVLCYFCTLMRFLEYSTRSFTLEGFQNKEAFVGVSSRQDYSNFASKYANALPWQNMVHVFDIYIYVLCGLDQKAYWDFLLEFFGIYCLSVHYPVEIVEL